MARITRRRLAAWTIGGIGIVLAAVVPEYLGQSASTDLLLGLSVTGAGFVWASAIWDDTICRRDRDERLAAIHYRAGYNAMLAYAASTGSLIFVGSNLDRRISVLTVGGVLLIGLAVYLASVTWFKRQM